MTNESMTHRSKRGFAPALCAALAAIFLSVAALTGCVLWVALDHGFYMAQFDRLGVQYSSGADRENLSVAAGGIIGYLAGTRAELDVEATVDDVYGPAFHERERAHMADVRGLFRLDGAVALACLALGGFCAWRALSHPRAGLRGGLLGAALGLCALALPALALAFAAVSDFEAPFILFHHLFFTNDLWLLDPRTDFMIRMLPQEFFEAALRAVAARTLICALALCASVAGVGLLLGNHRRKAA